MTAGYSTIARVDRSFARLRRSDRVTDGALLVGVAFLIAAVVVAGVAIAQVWHAHAPTDKVGVQR